LNETSEAIIRGNQPDLMRFIESDYTVAFIGASGTWHVRRQPDEVVGDR